jgi:hypothetical protein
MKQDTVSISKQIYWRVYYWLFVERFNKKIDFNFKKNIFRWDLINFLHKNNNFQSYLEIGCDEDLLFSKISIQNKIGVDPLFGGNTRKTSDQFFSTNQLNFDCVFIDGLHIYKQVKKDILNSLKCLNEGGYILVHDCLPHSLSSQAVPRYKITWNGDVWKAIVDLRQHDDIEIFTCLVDYGISIIQKKKNSDPLKIDKNISQLKFKDFYKNYTKYMRTITFDEFKLKFQNKQNP